MQNDKQISEIISSIATEDEKDRLTSQVEELSACLYKMDGQYQKKIGEVDNKVSEIIKTVPQSSLPEFFNTLKEKLIATASVKLTLSFNPTRDFASQLRQIVGGIVEIETDPEIIGGVVVEMAGKHHDLSIRRKLDDYLGSVFK